MLQANKQETNILTTSTFPSIRKIIYAIIFLLLGWFLINYIRSVIKEEQGVLLYKLADDDESDEYKEGAYWIYNVDTGEAAILDKHILMDYTEAWHTVKNQYVVLDLMSIKVLDRNRVVVEEKRINEEDLVIGGQYNRKLDKVFFLLRKGKAENYTIGLYEFDVENRSITQVIDHLDLGYEGIEEPFKKMFFTSKNKLLIKNYHYQFIEVDLVSKTTNEVIIDERNSGRLAGISQNKNGLVYLTYYGIFRHYRLMQYSFPNWFRSESVRELVEDITNIGWGNAKLVSDPQCSSFCLQVGSKVYVCDNHTMQEIPVNSIEILAYRKNILLYRNTSSEVIAYLLSKKTATPIQPSKPQDQGLKIEDELEEVNAIKESNSRDQGLKIEGRLEEVSPNEEWILYQVPSEEGRWDGETYKGILRALHIPTGKIIEIMEDVSYDANAHFLNNSQVAIPKEGQIELYNVDTEQWGEEVLMRYNKDYVLLKLSLNEDRTKAAILLIDVASRRGDTGQPDSNDRVELRVIDLKNDQEYVVDHDFDSEVACEYAGKILWHGDQIIYAVLNQLYYYPLNGPKQVPITDHLGTYSIKGDEIIYSILGEDWRYTFKSFSLLDFSTKVVEPDEGNLENTGDNKRILYKTDHLTIEHSPESVYKLTINSY